MRKRYFRMSGFVSLRRPPGYYPKIPRWRWLGRLVERHRHSASVFARVLLTFVVVEHLAAAAFFPGGRNPLFGLAAPAPLSYLTMFPVQGTMGFYKTSGKDGFLVYKIYTERGSVVEGAFPDQKATPRLRYDRLAMLAHHMSGDYPAFHYLFLGYLVDRLPGKSLKLELHSAKWTWNGAANPPAANGGKGSGLLVLRKLGSYDGLRKAWSPAKRNKKK